ncbi:MAG TPA: ABC transporter substrate-binding protein [Myxococcota bacterium]|nr:ABC transporter substrate-binding protein [Myxococcota bacterium]
MTSPRSHAERRDGSSGRRRARLACLLPLLVVGLVLGPSATADPEPPAAGGASAAIERFHATLLSAMKDGPKLGYAGREKLVAPAVDQTFDLAFMTKAALGRHWATLDAAQQEQLTQAFRRWSVANYASQFATFAGERFETLGEGEGGQGTTLVRTRIVETDGKATSLDYRMRETPGGWRVVDVLLDGTVSQLALYRADYSSVFERSGFEGLMATLDEKSANLAKAPPPR